MVPLQEAPGSSQLFLLPGERLGWRDESGPVWQGSGTDLEAADPAAEPSQLRDGQCYCRCLSLTEAPGAGMLWVTLLSKHPLRLY